MTILIKKVLRELATQKSKTILSLLALIIGMAGFGTIAITYSMISRDLPQVYDGIEPHSATIYMDNVDDNVVDVLAYSSVVESYEVNGYYTAKVSVGDVTKNMILIGMPEFESDPINRLALEDGIITPAYDETLIERKAFGVARTSIGETLEFLLPNGSSRAVKVVGQVHDLSMHPADVHDEVYAYVNMDTLESFGMEPNRIQVIMKSNPYDIPSIEADLKTLGKAFHDNQITFKSMEIAETPGASPHAGEYEIVTQILLIFGLVMYLLAALIIVNLITTLLTQQIRQIGVLKTIGANITDILMTYMFMILILSGIGLLIALPLSYVGGIGLTTTLLSIGNYNLSSPSIPVLTLAVLLITSFTIPLLMSMIPILNGCRITVKDAINNFGVQSFKQHGIFGALVSRLKQISTTVLMSIRNITRKQIQTVLTISILLIGGLGFLGALSTITAIEGTIDEQDSHTHYDYTVSMANSITTDELDSVIKSIDLIKDYEVVNSASVSIADSNALSGTTAIIRGMDINTEMITPLLRDGRWLSSDNSQEIIISDQLNADAHIYSVGDTISLSINDEVYTFDIVGIQKELMSTTLIINTEVFGQITGITNPETIVVSRRAVDEAIEDADAVMLKTIEERLAEEGIIVAYSSSIQNQLNIARNHFSSIIIFFVCIAFVIMVVGAIGLASSMSIQVIERTREIGILRSIGADSKHIRRSIINECIAVGLVSFLLSMLVSIPTIIGFNNIFGRIFIGAPFDLYLDYMPFVIWLVMVLVLTRLSANGPSKKAIRMSVKDALTFE